MMAQTRACPLGQCRLTADNAAKVRENIHKGDGNFLRLPLWLSCQAHHAGHALHKKIITQAGGIRLVLSKACNLGIDEGGVRGVQSVQIETKLCQTLGL
jgi:hypothetical protein